MFVDRAGDVGVGEKDTMVDPLSYSKFLDSVFFSISQKIVGERWEGESMEELVKRREGGDRVSWANPELDFDTTYPLTQRLSIIVSGQWKLHTLFRLRQRQY